jgi:hypothetical protein
MHEAVGTLIHACIFVPETGNAVKIYLWISMGSRIKITTYENMLMKMYTLGLKISLKCKVSVSSMGI